ncbi:MAG: M20/M25/M40 family metallo-hydrolase [Alphaproteobacteria bacterium]|nr:M20/M25/M40 family metallo-hydrolase [Alphaproteobacteria bacterium]
MLLSVLFAHAAPHHAVEVALDPAAGTLQVVDRLGGVEPGATFALHAGLSPAVATKGWTLERVGAEDRSVPVETWKLVSKKKKPKLPVELRYGGAIAHPLQTQGSEYQRSFSETPGTIQEDGVYLAPSTYWLPTFGDALVTYAIDPTVPEGWSTVVSGNPTETGWESAGPTNEAYLVAAAWSHTASEIETPSGTRGIDVYLREPDPGLAFRYTAATGRYLTLYEAMLTPYPFDRFALVENFWDTGYGMPGFTLLGPQVIRFPWILTSSYPHEVLHTWWGNSAGIAPTGGNWAEGLTAYMADHLFAEHRGQSDQHRRNTLKKYTDLAADQDFPLVEFEGRTSAATEAIGYGKSLMFWHMIRRHIGDEAFLEGLRAFHAAYVWKPAGFADLEPFLSEASGEDLKPFFEAWTTTSGAVRLTVADAKAEKDGDAWVVSGTLVQDGAKPAWVPLHVTGSGGRNAQVAVVALEGERTPFRIAVDADLATPQRLDVDPEFDVMRVLDPLEVPPALTTVLGEEKAVFVLPSQGTQAERAAWKELAAAWAKPGEPEILEDDAVDAPPPGSWVLGWANLHGPRIAKKLADVGAKVGDAGLSWQGETFDHTHSIALVARSDDPTRAVGWVTAGNAEAIKGLGRKLPHYTKYSLLAFSGTAPDNVAKATWEATTSPLTVALAKGALVPRKPGPAHPPLAEMPPRFDGDALLAEATWFADPAREGRGIGSKGLDEATRRITDELSEMGLALNQAWTEEIDGKQVELQNVVFTLPGDGRPLPPVLVMAHVDHLGMGEAHAREGNAGELHPGADDNASGVAVALALARVLASEPARPRPVTFVFTTAEESDLRGAKHYLAAKGKETAFACVVLDTVGRLGDAGITVIGAESARELRFLFMGVGYTTGAKLGFAQPGIGGSDQGACHEVGIPGVQLTTGATPDYHAPGDTADKLSAEGLELVADTALEAIAYLAERTDPLTVQLGGDAPAPSAGERKASLGTMPDFTFEGPGVLVADVMPDSAAQAAGLKPGDVLLAIDGKAVKDLRAFSELLKAKKPGDTVEVRYRRGDAEKTVKAKLKAR